MNSAYEVPSSARVASMAPTVETDMPSGATCGPLLPR